MTNYVIANYSPECRFYFITISDDVLHHTDYMWSVDFISHDRLLYTYNLGVI